MATDLAGLFGDPNALRDSILASSYDDKSSKKKKKKKKNKDQTANEAMRLEKEREQRILAGESAIQDAFGMFDEAFYRGFGDDYLGYYLPQLEEQYGDARMATRYDTARRGVQTSTPGIKRFTDLADIYAGQRRDLAQSAQRETLGLKSRVGAARNELLAQNSIAADPSLARSGAGSTIGALQATPQFSPLGNLFAGAVNGAAAYNQFQQNQLPPGYAQQFRTNAAVGGPARVVT